MRKLKVDYKYIEYITVALLSMVFLTIPIMHYICLRNGWPNDYLAYSIYGLAIIDIVFMAIVLLLFSNIKFKWGIYEWIFTVLIILEIFSVINSVDVYTSIWGTAGRNEGILMLLSYYTFFYLARFLKSDKSKYLLVNIFLGIGVVHCIYGLCQYFKLFENIVFSVSYGGSGIKGVTGNPNFMGTLVVMLGGLSAGLFYYSDKLWKKLIYLVLLGLFLVTMLLTKTMSGYFGVAMMVLVFFGYLTITRKKHIQFTAKYFSSFNILLVTVIVGIIGLFSINKLMKGYIFQELTNIYNELSHIITTGEIEESFGTYRFGIWKNTLQLVPHYLLSGVGVDALAMPFYYNFGLINDTIIDKTHNECLQILITMGLPALVTYLTYYFFVGKDVLVRLVEIVNQDRKWNGEPLYVGLGLVLIGYLCQAFFNISVIDVAPFFWVLLGLMSESMIEVQKRIEMVNNQKKYIRLPNGQVIEVMGTVKKNY